MDAATIALPVPDLWGRILKAAVVVPDLSISVLITFVLVAALPPEIALGVVAGMLVVSIVVTSGRAEGLAVRILHASRSATPFEAQRFAGPVRLVADRSGHEELCVLIGQGVEQVRAAGHRHVMLHRDVVDAHLTCRITDAEVAALIAHGVGRLGLAQPRLDLLVTLWTLPWDFIRGLFVGVGRQLSWVPLGRLAWQTRFVVGSIAVIFEAQAGRWPSPIVIAGFIGLSYLMPRARIAWNGYATEAGDRQGAEVGLAGPLAHILRRVHGGRTFAERLDLLAVRSDHRDSFRPRGQPVLYTAPGAGAVESRSPPARFSVGVPVRSRIGRVWLTGPGAAALPSAASRI